MVREEHGENFLHGEISLVNAISIILELIYFQSFQRAKELLTYKKQSFFSVISMRKNAFTVFYIFLKFKKQILTLEK